MTTPWQPIATAPKDGSLVVLWEKCDCEPFIGYWSLYRKRWRASLTYYCSDTGSVDDNVYSDGVTHWMPMPPSPIGE
jgi:hypothetical protein